MIRFVIGPDQLVVPDVAGALPGRGMWVTARRAVLKRAIDRNAFSRAARRAVRLPDDLLGDVERQLVRRCLDFLGLARRAGQAVTGFEKVKAAILAGRARVLVQASDAARHGRAKLKKGADVATTISEFSGAELSLAFGGENVIHAALGPGRLSEIFVAECGRLIGVRRGDDGPMAERSE